MKDIETGETIGMDTCISMGLEKDDRVYMETNTFNREIEMYSLIDSELSKLSLQEIHDNYILLNYDERDQLGNILDGPNPIFLEKKGNVFKKTLEHFLNRESIQIN